MTLRLVSSGSVPGGPSFRKGGRGYRLVRCSGCGLIPAACVCRGLPLVENRTRVTIVVHWRELQKPSNTARVGQRMLQNCELLVRGGPDATRGRDVEARLEEIPEARALLLYPREGALPLDTAALDDEPYHLIVPDGTWSQTRRLLRRYPVLQRVRAVCVTHATTTYALRRGIEAGQLCTLEAIASALGHLDGTFTSAPLWSGFSLWQRQALELRGISQEPR